MRTATPKKVDNQPSTSELSGHASAQRTLDLITDSLETSKAVDIVPLDIQGKSALADYMVIASGTSHRHVNAVADHLLRSLKANGQGTSRVEGLSNADWVLIDAGDVIIHIFRPEVREFYQLEKIWSEDIETVH